MFTQFVAVAVLITGLALLAAETVRMWQADRGWEMTRLPGADRPWLPITHAAASRQLARCLIILMPVERQLLSGALADLTSAACTRVANHSGRYWPTSGRVPLVSAGLAGLRQDWPGLIESVGQSASRAPGEGWLARLRLIQMLSLPSDALNGVHRQEWRRLVMDDAGLVLTTSSGADLIAAWYVRRPHLRPVLGAAIGTAIAEDEARVLRRIRLAGGV